jgi:hypothetical protein
MEGQIQNQQPAAEQVVPVAPVNGSQPNTAEGAVAAPVQPAELVAPVQPIVSSPGIDPALIQNFQQMPGFAQAPAQPSSQLSSAPAQQPPVSQPSTPAQPASPQFASPLAERVNSILQGGGTIEDVYNLVNVQRFDPEKMTAESKVEAFVASKYPGFGAEERAALLQSQYGYDPDNPASPQSKVAMARAAEDAHRFLSERKVAVDNPEAARQAAERQQAQAAEEARRMVYATQWQGILDASVPTLGKVDVYHKSDIGEYKFSYEHSKEAVDFAKNLTLQTLQAQGIPPTAQALQQASGLFRLFARGFDFERYNEAILKDVNSAATIEALRKLSGPLPKPNPVSDPAMPVQSSGQKPFWQRNDI